MALRNGNSGPIPEGWLHCPPNANNLIVSKFMALKTPLSENFDTKVPPELRYPTQKLFYLARSNNVKIGLWIDLTNTDRYYYKRDIEEQNCRYIKLRLKGHGNTPSREKTHKFISIVHNHILKYPFDRVAVHCTHGFNRTGFLIVAFLVEVLEFDVNTAVEAFADSRPPGIYRGEYIRELFHRYGNIKDIPPTPPLPTWCTEKKGSRGKRNHFYKNNFYGH